ncbi:MAG: hypothetical protein ACRD1V_04610 [Vicinamibacterales bacterium]
MHRSGTLKLIGLVVGAYGLYVALLLPGFFVGPPAPLLTACLLVEVITAFVAAVCLWRGASWAPIATIVFGAAVAAVQLVEAALIGIIALDRAILVGVVAVIVALAIAAYASGGRGFAARSQA